MEGKGAPRDAMLSLFFSKNSFLFLLHYSAGREDGKEEEGKKKVGGGKRKEGGHGWHGSAFILKSALSLFFVLLSVIAEGEKEKMGKGKDVRRSYH